MVREISWTKNVVIMKKRKIVLLISGGAMEIIFLAKPLKLSGLKKNSSEGLIVMSKKAKVHYQLSDLKGQAVPAEEDVKNILRAADEIIFVAGRTMLAKILKGSIDKNVLERGLDQCPS